jgi:hypothetical protein
MYKIDHSHFSFDFNYPQHLNHLIKNPKIKLINLKDLKAKLVINDNPIEHKNVDLNQTPHWDYLVGNKKPYLEYLKKYKENVGLEHSPKIYEKLIKSFKYLDKKYNKDYIICEKENNEYVIRDGLHRATILHFKNYDMIPVVVLDDTGDQLSYYFNDYKDTFLEWYTPLEITKSHIIHERTFPNYIERPEYLTNGERGQAKWDYIIERNIPNVKNKKICDIGCNVGLYAYNLLKLGAKSVDGYDRSETIVQPTNVNLPKQSVVQQAYYIKNLFQLRDNQQYPTLNFYELDINLADFSKFNYDILVSTCVLYHFGPKFNNIMADISKKIPIVILQTNLGHGGDLAKYSSVEYHKKLLTDNGYTVSIDAPLNYKYPVIVGVKV